MNVALCMINLNLAATFNEAWKLLSWGNPLGLFFSAIIGASFGSFANVVIFRFPRKQSLIKPASRCPSCHTPIRPLHNIPVISYFLLRGKSACCHELISLRYPVIELFGALIAATLYMLDGWTLTYVFHFAWMILLLILAAIDLEHYRLPNALVGIGIIISVLWMDFAPDQSWLDAGFGALVGVALGGLTLVTGKILKGRWSGMGDFKLLIVLGFTFGPERIFLLYLSASIAAILYYLVKGRKGDDHRVPMGPFFAVGTWLTIWVGGEIVRWYIGLLRL